MKHFVLTLFLVIALVLSLSAADRKPVSSATFPLFAPLTFYHDVAHQLFQLNDSAALDSTAAAVRAALLHVYLSRPDLVTFTESEQKATGGLREDVETPIEMPVVDLAPHVDAPVDELDEHPVELVVRRPNFWKLRADGSLQLMQNYVSGNWYKGGESNYSAVGAVTIEANFDNKSRWKWDNKLEAKIGLQTSRSDTLHKVKTTEDLLRYTGKVGLQAAKQWYYTLQLMAQTQTSRGYRANNRHVFSDFLSPLNVSVGLGMDYKVNWWNGHVTGTVNMSPLAVNYRYVDRTDLASGFGVKTPKHTHSLTDFGSQLTASLTVQVAGNVSWRTRIYGFTSYHRAQIEWENTIALRVSKYISANLFLFPRFDDAAQRKDGYGYWQFKEYSSLGFSYGF